MIFLLPLALAAGCKNFFSPVTGTGSGTGTTPTNTGDYAYVASVNTASASDPIYTLSGFSIGTGTLTALSGFPITLPFPPAMVAINPANTLLYVAGAQVIYGYTISSSGALTKVLNANQTQPLANANIVAMTISPDGQWLLALDATNTLVTVDEFQIQSNGLLIAEASTQYALTNGATIVPNGIAIAHTGNYVAVALGTGADVLFSFDTSTGALSAKTQVNPPSASSADQAVTFDSTGQTLYIARSGTDGGVVPYTIGSGGVLTLVSGSPFPLGANATGPSSILIDASGDYLYVGDKTSSTISGFSIGSGGVLTALSGSPYASGTSVGALGRDNTAKYVLATAVNGGPDVQMYSFDTATPGKLDPVTSAATGNPTEPAGAVAIALTH
jgi:6-phosphogluconolactonase (cycloisomerase 2 family)